MENFDFTQFITFDSDLLPGDIYTYLKLLFEESGFNVIKADDIDKVKVDYYKNYWGKYIFELKNDGFLIPFMDWKDEKLIPEKIQCFINNLNILLKCSISNVSIVICSFAQKGRTEDEVVYTSEQEISHELFKMSIHSFVCPNNLVIKITDPV